jgi:large subunit ribosomal protein L10
LVKRAFGDLEISDTAEFLTEETGIVFVHDKDIVRAAKVLVDFSKENENFQVKGGLLKGEKLDASAFNALAKLPPKEVLLGMAVGAMASPLTGFLTSLKQVILKFVWAVEEIKKNKGQS